MNTRRTAALMSICLSAAAGAWAQSGGQDSAAVLEEVIVTAEKRQGNLQQTAIAVTALQGEALARRQVSNVQDLAQSVPNVNFGQTTGNARIAIRGVGFDNITVGNEPRVAYHLDGVYLSRPVAALGTFFDIDRIEVLRGPQGTLYGRNATAGAVNVITREPGQSRDGYLRSAFGNYGLVKTQGALGGPIGEALAGRVAFQTTDRDGYGKNILTGEDIDDERSRSARAKFRLDPGGVFDAVLSADYHTEDDHNYGYHYIGQGGAAAPLGLRLGGIVAPDSRDSAGDVRPSNDRTIWGTSLAANWDFGPILNSITAYRRSEYRVIADLDNTSVALTLFDQRELSRQFSQELRLAGDFSHGDWLLGAYYFTEEVTGSTAVAFDRRVIGAPSLLTQGYFAGGGIDTEAAAIFGQVRWGLTDALTLTAGARLNTDKKEVDEVLQLDFARPYTPGAPITPVNQQMSSTRWDSFTPKLGLEYRLSDEVFVYSTVSKGFKSGGYNLGGIQPAFDPEILWDYEAGVKAEWLNRRLRTNVAAFVYDYEDLQVSKVQGTAIVIENAAKARLHGVEIEVAAALTTNLEIDLNAAYLDSEYEKFFTADPSRPTLGVLDLSGNQLTQAPKYTIDFGVQYGWLLRGGELTIRGESYFVDDVYFSPYNLEAVSQKAHSRHNVIVTLESAAGDWAISGFVRNLTNEDHIGTAAISTGLTGFPIIGALEPPRTYGVQLEWRF